jgi:hypothetical protein
VARAQGWGASGLLEDEAVAVGVVLETPFLADLTDGLDRALASRIHIALQRPRRLSRAKSASQLPRRNLGSGLTEGVAGGGSDGPDRPHAVVVTGSSRATAHHGSGGALEDDPAR